jgi:HSP20 family protein
MVESSFGSFQRSFQLPDTVDAGRIEASFEDGMLRVSVPKDEQKTMRHQIQVRGGQSTTGNNGASNGQLSERVSQQATDIAVSGIGNNGQSNTSNGTRKKSNSADQVAEMNGHPHSAGGGS